MREESQNPKPQTASELSSLEAMLASLSPTPALDRDQVVYEAGRAAGAAENIHQRLMRERLLSWAVAALLVLSVTTTTLWIQQRGNSSVVEDDSGENRIDQPSSERLPPGRLAKEVELQLAKDANELTLASWGTHDYVRLRNEVLQQGPDALPSPSESAGTDGGGPIPTSRSGLGDI